MKKYLKQQHHGFLYINLKYNYYYFYYYLFIKTPTSEGNILYCISDDCENKVRQMLTDIDISESDIRIVRCHRKGAKKENTDRPIIVRFHWFGDIKLIMSKNADLRKKSKNMNKFVTQDWPVEIEKRRRMLLPVLHRAKAAKYNARLIIDKLIVNNKTYTLNNLHELPEDINPKKFSTVENDDMMLFWGKYVSISTFHIGPT